MSVSEGTPPWSRDMFLLRPVGFPYANEAKPIELKTGANRGFGSPRKTSALITASY
jgi:hypothetical protein